MNHSNFDGKYKSKEFQKEIHLPNLRRPCIKMGGPYTGSLNILYYVLTNYISLTRSTRKVELSRPK